MCLTAAIYQYTRLCCCVHGHTDRRKMNYFFSDETFFTQSNNGGKSSRIFEKWVKKKSLSITGDRPQKPPFNITESKISQGENPPGPSSSTRLAPSPLALWAGGPQYLQQWAQGPLQNIPRMNTDTLKFVTECFVTPKIKLILFLSHD